MLAYTTPSKFVTNCKKKKRCKRRNNFWSLTALMWWKSFVFRPKTIISISTSVEKDFKSCFSFYNWLLNPRQVHLEISSLTCRSLSLRYYWNFFEWFLVLMKNWHVTNIIIWTFKKNKNMMRYWLTQVDTWQFI